VNIRNVVVIGALISSLALNGCALHKSLDSIEQAKDIRFFTKTATRIILHETKPDSEDMQILKRYLSGGKNLLDDDDLNFDSLRELVKYMLPEKYDIFAFTVIDVIERYVDAHILNIDENAAKRNDLILAGLDGAIAAIDEYIVTNTE